VTGPTAPVLPAVGVHPTCTDHSMPVVELALAAEERGLRSISLPEHTHIPLASDPIDERYRRTLDPFVASAFVAATTSLEVGTGVSLVAQHDAIALAKTIATLDHLSRGRVMLGVGYGYNRPEAADHGVPVDERAAVVEETVRLMKALWTQDEAAFEGRHRRLPPSFAWPKPHQPGGPPVLLGVRASARNFERIAAWADGWLPMGNGLADKPELEGDLADLRARWVDAGRDSEPQVCCFFMPGPVDAMARDVSRAAELGIQGAQVYVADRDRQDLLPILDDVAAAVARAEGR
jgi:probable F420-dependent oxidoreductase